MKTIIIFGPPGSGKGTQAKLLSKELNLIHFSTGEKLRKESNKKTKLGKQINSLTSKGNLVPDELSTRITKNFILSHNKYNLLLDGFPRTLNQAANLVTFLKEIKCDNIIVINLKVSKKELLKRLLERAKIEHRKDDNPKTIKQRLKIYHHQTKPIIKFLKKNKLKIFSFNGKGDISKIQKEIIKKIKFD